MFFFCFKMSFRCKRAIKEKWYFFPWQQEEFNPALNIQCLRRKMFINSYVNYSRFSYGAKCGLGLKFDQEETIWNDKVVSGQVEGQAVATDHIVPFFYFSSNDICTRLYLDMVLLYDTNS